jgi:pimeloyl-ACP methyl ester carboxylesterase
MRILLAFAVIAALFIGPVYAATPEKPTILLVHGAFADASSWNGVIARLKREGYRVVAVANPLRGVKHDGRYLADIAEGIGSPVVLVGHSYGGFVISEVNALNVHALVYVAGFAPDAGESAFGLSVKFPGSTLGDALAKPVTLSGGGKDLYIQHAKFHEQFAADVPPDTAVAMAAGQRPVTEAALNEGASGAAWKTIPSWFIYGDADRNIPAPALKFMAERANARGTEVVRGASHAVMVSNPDAVAALIVRAAQTAESTLQASVRN